MTTPVLPFMLRPTPRIHPALVGEIGPRRPDIPIVMMWVEPEDRMWNKFSKRWEVKPSSRP